MIYEYRLFYFPRGNNAVLRYKSLRGCLASLFYHSGAVWLHFFDYLGVFGLVNLVTQFSIFIIHNSKIVGPIAKRLFGK